MTSPEFSDRRRLIRSSLVAAAFWLVLVAALSLVSFVAPVKQVRQFMPVHLTLAGPAVVASTPAANPAASAASSASAATSETAAGSVTAAGPKSPKPAAGKTAAAKNEPAKAAGGLGIPNFSSAPSSGSSRAAAGSVSGNSLDFASSGDEAIPAASQAPKGSNAVAEFEGAAASVVSPSSRGSGKTARSGAGGSQGSAVSGDTSASLGDIAAAAKSGVAGSSGGLSGNHGVASGVQGGGKTGGSASSGAVSGIAFDGAARKLLYPAKPAIALPDNLAKLVDSSRSVTVSFTVLADGSVPAGGISFTPSAILPVEVRDYLRREFSSWRFEKSAEDGQARFLYSIRVE